MLAILPTYLIISMGVAIFITSFLVLLYSMGRYDLDRKRAISLTTAFSIASYLFLLVAGYINIEYLPMLRELKSIITSFAISLPFFLIGYFLYRILAKTLLRMPIKSFIRLLSAILIIPIFVTMLIYFLTRFSYHPNVSELGSNSQSAGPNIILITIDTLRADHLSGYGYNRETTPFIDQLAKQGATFTRDTSASSWTKPATASLLTSLYPSGHQTNTFTARIPEAIDTLPEVLKKHNYLTMAFSSNAHVSPVFGFSQGFDYFHWTIIHYGPTSTIIFRVLEVINKRLPTELGLVPKMERPLDGGAYSDKELVKKFKETIASARKRPYFAYLHFIAPHSPFIPQPPYNGKFTDPKWKNVQAREMFHDFQRNNDSCDERISSDELAHMIALYDGEIAFSDDLLRELYDIINKDSKRETLLIVTSDHGEEFYEHCRFGHGYSLYQEQLWVPLIFYYPPKVPAGLKLSFNVSNVDIAPTILSLAGLPPEPKFMGKNLTPFIEHPDSNTAGYEPESYSELINEHIYTSLIRENYKIIISQKEKGIFEEIFNLELDPHENSNLLNLVEFNAIRKNLKSRLDANLQRAEKTKIEGVDVEVNEDIKEKLKAIGYVQ